MPLSLIKIEPTPNDFTIEEWEEIISEPFDWVAELVKLGQCEPPAAEAERWLYGQCAQLAYALWRRDPERLRFGVLAIADGGHFNPWHVFVHDEYTAYDALGRHELGSYELPHAYGRRDLDLPLSEVDHFYSRQLADEEGIAEAEKFISSSELMFDHNFDFLGEDDIRTKGSTDMTSTYIDPALGAVALIDPYDEESGSELSAHGRQVVREKLQAQGYGDVIFCPAHEMAGLVAAYPGGLWLQPDSQPVEGWSYFDAPDAEILVDQAGIDFTDPKMWA